MNGIHIALFILLSIFLRYNLFWIGAGTGAIIKGMEDMDMPIYITLFKFTDQGIKAVKDTPARNEDNFKFIEAMGGKVKGLYYTLGEYDIVAISEMPTDEVGMTCALKIGSSGFVRTTTLKAFSFEEFTEIIKKLP